MYCSDNCKTVPPHHSVCLCHITKDYGTSRVHWGRGGGGERGTVLQSRAWCSFRISPRQLDHLLFTYKIYWTHWIIVIIGPCVTTEKRKLYLSPKNSYLHKNNESALFVFLLLLFFVLFCLFLAKRSKPLPLQLACEYWVLLIPKPLVLCSLEHNVFCGMNFARGKYGSCK